MTDGPDEESGIGRRRAAALAGTGAGYHERRAEIVRATATLFRAKGYRGTSLADVAAAVGIDRATIYYYFDSKEALFDEIVSDLVRANLAVAEAIRDGDEPAPDKLRRLVTGLMASYAEHYPFLYVYLQENLAHVGERRRAWSRDMRVVNRRYESAVEAIIADGMEAGTLTPVAEPWVLAYGVIGMVSWTNRWFDPNDADVDAATVGEAYARVLLEGLVARAGD